MSYQVYDENGYVGDFATTKGCHDFMQWCESTGDVDLKRFFNSGSSIFPMSLMEALELFDPPLGEVEKTYNNFLELLPKCKGIVIISDGINDDLEDEDDLAELLE